MQVKILLLLMIPILVSCRKQDPAPDPTPDPNDPYKSFEMLWQVPLNPDTTTCISMAPVVFNGTVTYSMLFYKEEYEVIRNVKAQNGAFLWEWTPPYPGEVTPRLSRKQDQDLLAISHGNTYYGLDLNTGQPRWTSRVGTAASIGSHIITIHGNHLYTEHSNRQTLDTISFLVRGSLQTGQWDTIFRADMRDGYRPTLHAPALWVNPQGDSILIFQNRQWNFPASDGRFDLLALNLQTRQLVWEVRDFDPKGNSSIDHMLVHNDQVFFCAEDVLYCFDAATGNIRWSWKAPKAGDNLVLTNLVVAEGKLFVKPTNENNLYSLHPQTGEVNNVYACGAGDVKMTYYNGILYFSSGGDGKIYALRLSDGQWIWNFYSPNRTKPGKARGSALFDHLTVSPEYNCVFVSDQHFLMAVKLPQ